MPILEQPAANLPTVAVVIATTCERRRWESLNRAIESVLSQNHVDASVIVIVNGTRFDPELLETLKANARLNVVYQEKGSLPLALRRGRSLVAASFFAFLDDDDEYLPDALNNRLAPLLADAALDFVASNGFRRSQGKEELLIQNVGAVQANPLLALATTNWLASCGGLFRTSTVELAYFDGETAYLEWTFLAYKLASRLRMTFVDVPTFRIFDSEASLSKSPAYFEAEAVVLPQILRLELPPVVRRAVLEKMGRAYHNMAGYNHQIGRRGKAWRFHLASLRYPGGWKYTLYSRKLIFPF